MRKVESMERVARFGDEQLVRLATAGDVPATAELFHRYYRHAFTAARRTHRDLTDPSALIGEAFRHALQVSRVGGGQPVDFPAQLTDSLQVVAQVLAPVRPAAPRGRRFAEMLRWTPAPVALAA